MRTDALQSALSTAFGDPVTLVAAWRRPPTPVVSGAPEWHAVVALDPVRMTGLRDWRDAVEPVLKGPDGDVQVTAEELGRWVRRLRRGHGGAWAQALTVPSIAPSPNLLSELVPHLEAVPEEVMAWWPGEVPEVLRRHARPGVGLPDVSALDGWLAQARRRVADTLAETPSTHDAVERR